MMMIILYYIRYVRHFNVIIVFYWLDVSSMPAFVVILQCLNYTIPLKELVFERRNIKPAIKKDGPVTNAMSALLTDKCSSEANCVAPEHLKVKV